MRRPTSAMLMAVSALLFTMAAYRGQAAEPRVIEIIATSDNVFQVVGSKKPVITAHPGEVLKLQITVQAHRGATTPTVHSITIEELKDRGWDILLFEGTKTYTLVAPEEPGKYVFECIVVRGDGHDDMRGKLVVK